MSDHISGQFFYPFRMPQYSRHGTHGAFTGLYLLWISPFFHAFFIIFFDFFRLLIGKEHPRQTRFIGNADGNPIVTGFLHGITIDDRTKNGYRFINRRSCKSAVRRIGEAVPEILGKAEGRIHARRIFLQFRANIYLRPVCLIGNTDDIVSVRKKSRIFTEFLYRRNIDAAAGLVSKGLF